MLAFALVDASDGFAKGYALVFDRVSAAPGEHVIARVPGTPRAGELGIEQAPRARVFLVALRRAPGIRRFLPLDPRLIELGELEGSLGYGRIAFRMPNVPPGPYTTAVLHRGAVFVTHVDARLGYGRQAFFVRGAQPPARSSFRSTEAIAGASLALLGLFAVRRARRRGMPWA